VDEGVHLLDFFFLDELGRIEVFDFSRNLRIVTGRIESRDAADTRLPGAQRLPSLVYSGAQRSHQSKAGYHDTSDGSILHR